MAVLQDRGLYELYRAKALAASSRGEWELFLRYAESAARTAWEKRLSTDFSLWSDRELEDKLSELSSLLLAGRRPAPPGSGSVAFVASTLYDVGGHSETLRIWSELLEEEYPERDLILTGGCGQEHFFPLLESRLRSRGVRITALNPRLPRLKRAVEVQEILAHRGFACIFLFIHPNDAVAVAATAALADHLPVVFYNHADIDFWLGANCFRHYVDFREEGAVYSLQERGVASTYVIPLTAEIPRVEAKRKDYGIPEEATVSISLGSFWKTTADARYSYFGTIGRILKRHPLHYHLFVTTPPPEEALLRLLPLERETWRRFRVTGPHADVRPFYSISDFVIETFPLVGGCVRMEAMALGLPIVAFDNPSETLYSRTDVLDEDYPLTARSEEEVVELSSALIQDPWLRWKYGTDLKKKFEEHFSPEVIRGYLLDLIREVRA